MCGIAGFAGISVPEPDARVRAMCNAITHRGPDSDGYFVADGIAMGMRRLSIIDVGGGRQPISNEDGTVTVVFNGEIYNHHTLRRQLEATGHRFSTHSDTEVLVHLYEDFGTEMVSRLQGMFAFSIWDSRKKMLFIARDRTGMKPLSYMVVPGGVVYCSELRSLWAYDSTQLHISPSAVMQYLAFGYVPDPHSIFEGVRKLPPGHLLVWSQDSGVEIRKYWSAPAISDQLVDEEELVIEIKNKLDKAVVSHLESEVPLGAFLSGGLDSSTIVALMSQHASGRVRTFSIGFAEEEYDESEAAKEVAASFSAEHTALSVRPNVEELFESVATLFDEPFGDASAIPTFMVAQLARQSVTVALSGDAGDELFGGYTRYGDMLRRGISDMNPFGKYLSSLGLMLPHVFPGRNRIIDLGRSKWGQYAAKVVQPVRINEGGVARASILGGGKVIAEQLHEYIGNEIDEDFAAAMMRVDLQSYLPGDILTKVDRTTMAVSLEARVPLLDFDLVDFAMSIPGYLRVTSNESKRLFRRAIRGLVPDFVLTRPKRGFSVPLGRWFRGPLRHRIENLRKLSPGLRPYIDQSAVDRLISEHLVGRRDHSVMMWRLIVLDYWFAALQEGRLGQPPSVPAISFTY